MDWRASESPEGTDGITSVASFLGLASLDSSYTPKQRRHHVQSVRSAALPAADAVRLAERAVRSQQGMPYQPTPYQLPAPHDAAARPEHPFTHAHKRQSWVPSPSHVCRTGACQQPDAYPDRAPGSVPAAALSCQGPSSRVLPLCLNAASTSSCFLRRATHSLTCFRSRRNMINSNSTPGLVAPTMLEAKARIPQP